MKNLLFLLLCFPAAYLPAQININSITGASCGACDGKISLTVYGGTPPYTYTWNNPSLPGLPELEGLCGEIYRLTVTDAAGFTMVSQSFDLNPPPFQGTTMWSENPTCSGVCNGSAALLGIGGLYENHWNTGAINSSSLSNLCPGSYAVTVAYMPGGCSMVYKAELEAEGCMLTTITTTDASCAGFSNGTAGVTVSGGTPPLTYLWSNGATTQTITGTGDTYTVTVTDAMGCTKSVSAAIEFAVNLNLATIIQPAAAGQSNGTIDLTVTGGNASYEYTWQWQPGGANVPFEDLINIPSGTYCVTVTDGQNWVCTATKCVSVGSISDGTCPPLTFTYFHSTGELWVQPDGPQIMYSWSGPNGFSNNWLYFFVPAPGNYCVTTTNTYTGCIATGCYTVGNSPLSINPQVYDNNCGSFQCGGVVELNVSGGTISSSYTFLWSNGATTEDIDDLCGGTYTVTITAGSETIIKSFSIGGGDGFTFKPILITSSNPAYCNSPSSLPNNTVCEKVCPNTTVTYSIAPPEGCVNPPTQFEWFVGGAQSWNVSNDTREVNVRWGGTGPGEIQVRGEGPDGCFSGKWCIEITDEPKAKFVANPAPDPATGALKICKGQQVYFKNQSFNAEVFEWQFSDNQSNTNTPDAEHQFNLPGTFTVLLIARSECLCADSAWLTVEVLDAVTPLLDCVNTTCPGEQTTYTADASCGNYEWNISPNGTITEGGGPADNSVTVIWNGGAEGIISLNATACSGSTCPAAAVAVIPILNDEADIEGRNRVCPNNEETYKITLFKGSNYVWSIKPGTGTILEGQGRDKISVAWTGSNTDTWVAVEYDNCYLGCTGRDTLQVKIRPPFYVSGALEKCEGSGGVHSAIRTTGGNVFSSWRVLLPSGETIGNIPDGNSANINYNTGPGTYQIFAIPTGPGLDATCSDSAAMTVQVKPNPPAPSGISGPTVFCAGEPLVYSANATSALFNIKWAIKNTNASPLTDEGPGTVVKFTSGSPRWVMAQQISTDGLGCLSPVVQLNVTEMPDFQLTGPTAICQGDIGTYSAPVQQGIGYFWTIVPATAGVIREGQNSPTLKVYWTEPGDHTVIATACGKNATFGTTVNSLPQPDPVYPDGLCPGALAQVDANGFYTGYQWKKSNGQIIGNNISAAVGPGSYALSIVDINGCKASKEFSIGEYPLPNVRISTIDPLEYCNVPVNVIFTALVNAEGTFDYQWFKDGVTLPETSEVLWANAFGDYRVQVTNEYGCTASDGDVEIRENCAPPGPTGNVNCNTQTCTEIDFKIVATAECDSITFVNNTPAPFIAGSEIWSIRRQGFGQLAVLTGPSAGFRFPNAGQFIAQLTIQRNDGSYCIIAKEVVIWAHAQFDMEPGCPGAPTLFTDESTFFPNAETGANWHWDFNDFASANTDTSTLRNTSWAFANPLIYNVKLTVTAPNGCSSTVIRPVNIPNLPTVTFLPPTIKCEQNAIPLSIVPDASIVKTEWNFGDPGSGAQNTASGTNVFHTFQSSNSYQVKATVTNINGCVQTGTFPVQITPNPFYGLISPVQSTICEGKSLTLEAPNSYSANSFLWSDGSTGPTLNVDEAGAYDVTITSTQGCTYSPPAKTIEVNPAPDGAINALLYNDLGQISGYVENQLKVCKGEDVYLEVKDNNGFHEYIWSGGLGTGDDQSFTEDRENLLPVGTYNYAVTITNINTGCSAVTPMFTVTVNPTPEGFSAVSDQNCAGTPATVSYLGPQPAGWQYFWNNGEVGTSFQTDDPGHFFVKVINEFGCRAESERVTIHPGPNIAAIPGGCHVRCRPDTLCFAPMPEIVSWQWYFEGAPVTGADQQQFVATESGSYYVAVTDTNDCHTVSEPINLTLYTGYGNVSGQVWSDVNDNGVIDAADTLLADVPVLLWQNDTLLLHRQTDLNGDFIFADVPATDYVVSLDSALIPAFWEIITGAVPASLEGCDSKDQTALLVHIVECVTVTHQIGVSVCPGTSYDYFGTLIAVGDSAVFNLQHTVTGCDSLLTIHVSAIDIPQTTLSRAVCEGESFMYNGISIPAGTVQNVILINPANGCDSIVSVSVTALPLSSIDTLVEVCPGEKYPYNGLYLEPDSTYEFHYTTHQGECDSTVYIHVTNSPGAVFSLASARSCLNVATGAITVENFAGGAPPYAFSNDDQNWQSDLVFNNLSPGFYEISARDTNNCLFKNTVEIASVAPLAVSLPAAVLIPCDTPFVEITPLVSGDLTQLHRLWNTGDTTAVLVVTDAGEYIFTAQNECESISRSTTVSWAELPENQDFVYVPNTVAPEDEKAVNAVFKSFFVPGVDVLQFKMEVFDRWGDLVWRGFDVSDGWDTRDALKKRHIAGAAVFVWYIEADIMWCGRPVQVTRKGDVTVLR